MKIERTSNVVNTLEEFARNHNIDCPAMKDQ